MNDTYTMYSCGGDGDLRRNRYRRASEKTRCACALSRFGRHSRAREPLYYIVTGTSTTATRKQNVGIRRIFVWYVRNNMLNPIFCYVQTHDIMYIIRILNNIRKDRTIQHLRDNVVVPMWWVLEIGKKQKKVDIIFFSWLTYVFKKVFLRYFSPTPHPLLINISLSRPWV